MGRRLAGHVIVGGEVFGPSDDLPEWAAKQITNPKAWAEPYDQGGDLPEGVSEVVNESDDAVRVVTKPAGNASIEAWTEYAKSQGVDDLDGLTRNEIRDLFE